MKPTAVSRTPESCRNASSTPQKHPAANVAFSFSFSISISVSRSAGGVDKRADLRRLLPQPMVRLDRLGRRRGVKLDPALGERGPRLPGNLQPAMHAAADHDRARAVLEDL